MAEQERFLARKVHEALLSAHPHAGDVDLLKAEGLTFTTEPMNEFRCKTMLAIQAARKAIAEGSSAAEGEQLLLEAIRAAEHWVKAVG